MVKTVLIVGGGIAGMTAALAMHRAGIAVTLIDADPDWRVYGAGISITGMAMRAFDDLGILPEVRARGYVGSSMRPRAVSGAPLGPPPPTQPDDAPPILLSGGIMRPVLHEIMSTRVRAADIEIRLGVTVASLEQDADGVDIGLSDGSEARFDLVVGADGIFSATRERLFPDAVRPHFTGQGCWRVVADRPPEVDRPEIYFGGPVKLGMSPISQTQMYVFILEHVPDNRWFAPESYIAHVDSLMAPFGGAVPAIRAALGETSQIIYRPLEWLLLPGPWFDGRVVLIGDAAHATTPHMASGAGLAVEDGIVLAEEIAGTDDVGAALEAFMTRRFERARLVVESSVRMGELEMSDGDKVQANRVMAATMQALHQPY